eukprot:jgi/Botrbrau1/3897/Bobra.0183s0118.1
MTWATSHGRAGLVEMLSVSPRRPCMQQAPSVFVHSLDHSSILGRPKEHVAVVGDVHWVSNRVHETLGGSTWGRKARDAAIADMAVKDPSCHWWAPFFDNIAPGVDIAARPLLSFVGCFSRKVTPAVYPSTGVKRGPSTMFIISMYVIFMCVKVCHNLLVLGGSADANDEEAALLKEEVRVLRESARSNRQTLEAWQRAALRSSTDAASARPAPLDPPGWPPSWDPPVAPQHHRNLLGCPHVQPPNSHVHPCCRDPRDQTHGPSQPEADACKYGAAPWGHAAEESPCRTAGLAHVAPTCCRCREAGKLQGEPAGGGCQLGHVDAACSRNTVLKSQRTRDCANCTFCGTQDLGLAGQRPDTGPAEPRRCGCSCAVEQRAEEGGGEVGARSGRAGGEAGWGNRPEPSTLNRQQGFEGGRCVVDGSEHVPSQASHLAHGARQDQAAVGNSARGSHGLQDRQPNTDHTRPCTQSQTAEAGSSHPPSMGASFAQPQNVGSGFAEPHAVGASCAFPQNVGAGSALHQTVGTGFAQAPSVGAGSAEPHALRACAAQPRIRGTSFAQQPQNAGARFAHPQGVGANVGQPQTVGARSTQYHTVETSFAQPQNGGASFAHPQAVEASFARPQTVGAGPSQHQSMATSFVQPQDAGVSSAHPRTVEASFAQPPHVGASFAQNQPVESRPIADVGAGVAQPQQWVPGAQCTAPQHPRAPVGPPGVPFPAGEQAYNPRIHPEFQQIPRPPHFHTQPQSLNHTDHFSGLTHVAPQRTSGVLLRPAQGPQGHVQQAPVPTAAIHEHRTYAPAFGEAPVPPAPVPPQQGPIPPANVHPSQHSSRHALSSQSYGLQERNPANMAAQPRNWGFTAPQALPGNPGYRPEGPIQAGGPAPTGASPGHGPWTAGTAHTSMHSGYHQAMCGHVAMQPADLAHWCPQVPNQDPGRQGLVNWHPFQEPRHMPASDGTQDRAPRFCGDQPTEPLVFLRGPHPPPPLEMWGSAVLGLQQGRPTVLHAGAPQDLPSAFLATQHAPDSGDTPQPRGGQAPLPSPYRPSCNGPPPTPRDAFSGNPGPPEDFHSSREAPRGQATMAQQGATGPDTPPSWHSSPSACEPYGRAYHMGVSTCLFGGHTPPCGQPHDGHAGPRGSTQPGLATPTSRHANSVSSWGLEQGPAPQMGPPQSLVPHRRDTPETPGPVGETTSDAQAGFYGFQLVSHGFPIPSRPVGTVGPPPQVLGARDTHVPGWESQMQGFDDTHDNPLWTQATLLWSTPRPPMTGLVQAASPEGNPSPQGQPRKPSKDDLITINESPPHFQSPTRQHATPAALVPQSPGDRSSPACHSQVAMPVWSHSGHSQTQTTASSFSFQAASAGAEGTQAAPRHPARARSPVGTPLEGPETDHDVYVASPQRPLVALVASGPDLQSKGLGTPGGSHVVHYHGQRPCHEATTELSSHEEPIPKDIAATHRQCQAAITGTVCSRMLEEGAKRFEVHQLQEENWKLQAAVEEVEEQLGTLRVDFDQVRMLDEKQQQEIASFKASLSAWKGRAEAAEEQYKSREVQLGVLAAQLKKTADELADVETERSDLARKLADSETRIIHVTADAAEERAGFTRRLAEKEQRMEQLRNEKDANVGDLRVQLEVAQDKCSAAESHASRVAEQYSQASRALQEERVDREAATRCAQEAEKREKAASQACTSANERAKKLEGQVAAMTEQQEARATEVAAAAIRGAKLEAEVGRLKEELVSKDEVVRRLRVQVPALQDEVKTVRALLEEGQNEADVLLRQAREQAQSAIASGHDAVKLQAQLRQQESRERLMREQLKKTAEEVVDLRLQLRRQAEEADTKTGRRHVSRSSPAPRCGAPASEVPAHLPCRNPIEAALEAETAEHRFQPISPIEPYGNPIETALEAEATEHRTWRARADQLSWQICTLEAEHRAAVQRSAEWARRAGAAEAVTCPSRGVRLGVPIQAHGGKDASVGTPESLQSHQCVLQGPAANLVESNSAPLETASARTGPQGATCNKTTAMSADRREPATTCRGQGMPSTQAEGLVDEPKVVVDGTPEGKMPPFSQSRSDEAVADPSRLEEAPGGDQSRACQAQSLMQGPCTTTGKGPRGQVPRLSVPPPVPGDRCGMGSPRTAHAAAQPMDCRPESGPAGDPRGRSTQGGSFLWTGNLSGNRTMPGMRSDAVVPGGEGELQEVRAVVPAEVGSTGPAGARPPIVKKFWQKTLCQAGAGTGTEPPAKEEGDDIVHGIMNMTCPAESEVGDKGLEQHGGSRTSCVSSPGGCAQRGESLRTPGKTYAGIFAADLAAQKGKPARRERDPGGDIPGVHSEQISAQMHKECAPGKCGRGNEFTEQCCSGEPSTFEQPDGHFKQAYYSLPDRGFQPELVKSAGQLVTGKALDRLEEGLEGRAACVATKPTNGGRRVSKLTYIPEDLGFAADPKHDAILAGVHAALPNTSPQW